MAQKKKSKTIIWSNLEITPFVEKEALKQGIDLEQLNEEQLSLFLKRINKDNMWVLENEVKPQFDMIFKRPLFAIATIFNENRSKVGQSAEYIGENSKNIFDIPFEYATWYYDSWNIGAFIKKDNLEYEYVFREMRAGKNGKLFVETTNSNRKLLTPTFMGGYTQTLLLNKRRKRVRL